MKIEKSAIIYFTFQGIAVIAWWILLITVPVSRKYFQLGDSETVLLAFCLPDLFLFAIGSLVLSLLIAFNNRFMAIVLWFVVGTISYATLYCLSFALLTDTGWLGVTAMFTAMIWSGNFAVGLTPTSKQVMFRRSKEAKTGWILAKTFAQIIVVRYSAFFVSVSTNFGNSSISFRQFNRAFSRLHDGKNRSRNAFTDRHREQIGC
jgi:hypothetical protein